MLAKLLVIEDLGESWFRLEFDCPELARQCKAGQFVQVETGSGIDPIIRRPFSVYDIYPEPGPKATGIALLIQRVGPGTKWLSELREGQLVDLLGPLGQPYPAPPAKPESNILLVGGGIGVAPLYLYSRELQQAGTHKNYQVLIGARHKSLLVTQKDFERNGLPVAVATDDGSAGHHGNVVELLNLTREKLSNPTEVFGIACGPHGMNLALRDYATKEELDFWISLDVYMPCGYGACFGCVIPSPEGHSSQYRRVCLEGPAFPANELLELT